MPVAQILGFPVISFSITGSVGRLTKRRPRPEFSQVRKATSLTSGGCQKSCAAKQGAGHRAPVLLAIQCCSVRMFLIRFSHRPTQRLLPELPPATVTQHQAGCHCPIQHAWMLVSWSAWSGAFWASSSFPQTWPDQGSLPICGYTQGPKYHGIAQFLFEMTGTPGACEKDLSWLSCLVAKTTCYSASSCWTYIVEFNNKQINK